MTESAQDWKEGFGDWYRNIKGIAIERDINPFGLLYDSDEADYYREYYEKLQKDFEKMKKGKWKNLKSGMGRDRSELMATGGIVDGPLPGRSRYI